MKSHEKFGTNFFAAIKHAKKSQRTKNKIVVAVQIIAIILITAMMVQAFVKH